MRRKTRITLVAVLFFALVAGGGGTIYLRQRMLDQRALANRATGMEAAKSGDNKVALDQLGRYLQRFGQEDDAEALYEYARARRSIELPNGKHIPQAISLMLRSVQIDPGNMAAQHELLELYVMAGYGQESLKLADTLLEKDPNDIAALRAEVTTQTRLRNYEEALTKAARIAELAPLDVENHVLALTLLDKNPDADDQILAYPESQKGLDPEQAAFCLIKSVSLDLTGNRPEAITWAKRAGERVQPDSKEVLLVNRFLDSLGQFDDSMNLLTRVAPNSTDLSLKRAYAQRLFEFGDMAAVIAQTDGTAYPEMDSALLAIRAMACGRQNNAEELKKVVSELEHRTDDGIAKSWTPLLRAVWLGENHAPKEMVNICTTALESDPANPFFYYFQGLAYEQLGEKDQAIAAWQKTIMSAPAWIDPILRGASLLAGTGRQAEALALAQEALRRAPSSVTVAAASAEIIGANIDKLTENDQKNLLKISQQVQAAKPMEPRTLPLVVDILARQGASTTAAETIQSAIDSTEPVAESTLLKLAQLSDRYELGLSQACYDKIGGLNGSSANLAFAQAMSTLKSGDPQRGREVLESAAKAAGNDMQWQIVVAQYLEAMGSPDATPAWVAIADAAPENAMIQQRVLGSMAAWKDTEMINRVIENLKAQTSENAVTWRIARARWLLLTNTDPDSYQKAAAEAASILNETSASSLTDVERYTLLANALERLGNLEGAIDNLTRATQAAPDRVGIRFELIRLLGLRGKTDEIALQLESILQTKNATPNDLRRAADLLASQNQVDRAIAVLLKLHPEDDQNAPKDLQLAVMYRRKGELDKAEAICTRILQEEPDARTIEFAADLFASQGRKEEAQAVLNRLDGIKLSPGTREMILAEHNRLYGTPESATQSYDEALKASKDNPAIWRRAIAFQIRAGELEQGILRIQEAATACPDDKALAALAGQIPLVQKVQSNPMALPFILAAIESPEHLPDVLPTLQLLDQTPANDMGALADGFRKLADEHPAFLPITLQLVRLYGALNRHDEAAEIASNAMIDFPNEVEPAMLASEAYAARKNWTETLSSAEEWRRRSSARPVAADLMIANAQIYLDRPADALETLKPYLDARSEDPAAYSPVVASQARALIHTGKITEAAELLKPGLKLSNPWRMAWIQFAALDIADTGVAADWLNEIEPLLPPDNVDEHVALASSWGELFERAKQAAYSDKALAILQSLASQPEAKGSVVLALAIAQERAEKFAEAEENYTLALKIDPSLTAARNNLAMRYISENKNLNDALALAEQAAKEAPRNANCLDTLSQAQAALGNYDAAIQSLNTAIELEPDNPQWRDHIESLKLKQQDAAGSAPAAAQ